MLFCMIIIGAIFAVLSTAIMMYISIASYIGPWIGPTLALLGLGSTKLIPARWNKNAYVAYITCAGSVGGILATAIGFSYPTLYFLDADLFHYLMRTPLHSACALSGLALSGGLLGFFVADYYEEQLIEQQKLPFPIGQMICKIINAHNSLIKSYQLIGGCVSSVSFALFQYIRIGGSILIPKSIALSHTYTVGACVVPAFVIELSPFLWAIGFVTGKMIVQPLVIGAVARYTLIEIIMRYFFPSAGMENFLFAFCGGLVLFSAAQSFVQLPKEIAKLFAQASKKNMTDWSWCFPRQFLLISIGAGTCCLGYLMYIRMPILSQLFLIGATMVCCYQIAVIAGEIGLAQMGRFATFVMVPAMFMFQLNYIHIVVIATFVEIASGVTVDILFGRKVLRELRLQRTTMWWMQLFGLVIAAATCGIVFWILTRTFTLGSPEFFAGRAQSRKLLILAHHFDYTIIILGALFGWFLKYIRVNPLLAMGGILMPLYSSIGLLIGALCNIACNNAEDWVPFWSGVFAGNSLWMLVQTIL